MCFELPLNDPDAPHHVSITTPAGNTVSGIAAFKTKDQYSEYLKKKNANGDYWRLES